MSSPIAEYKGYIGIGIVVATIILSVFGQGAMIQNQTETATARHKEQLAILEAQQKETTTSLQEIMQSLQMFKQEMDYKISDIKRDISTIRIEMVEKTTDRITGAQIKTWLRLFCNKNNLDFIDPATLQGN